MRYKYLVSFLVLLSGCSKPEESKLLPFKPTGDVRHVMQFVLNPAAAKIWRSAGSIITEAGEQDLRPTTDEGWLAVQHSAVVVAESGNLLLLPGLARDGEDWQEISLALIDVGMRAKAAAEAHDADALFDVGGQIYRICQSCHQIYIQGVTKINPLGG